MKRIIVKKHKNRQAFTLAEIIVVLLILAVIAAMIVPALTGYIKRTRREKYITNARYALTASQAVMDELFGLGPGAMSNGTNVNGGGLGADVRWDTKYNNSSSINYKYGDKVLQLMDRNRDNEPHIFVFGVGNSQVKSLSDAEKYTVYYVGYVENERSPAVFYINGEWIFTYPRADANIMKEVTFEMMDGTSKGIRNTIVKDGANIPLQMYVVSTYKKDNFWRLQEGSDTLEGHSEPNFKW